MGKHAPTLVQSEHAWMSLAPPSEFAQRMFRLTRQDSGAIEAKPTLIATRCGGFFMPDPS